MKDRAVAFHPFAYLAAFGLSGAMSGMLMCVNTLLMLDRGLSLAQVALGLSLLSITQVLLEVPSGMLGDLYGRKRIWIAAMLVRLCYLPLFFCLPAGPSCWQDMCNGAGNALNSGALDTMYLENWLHTRGKRNACTRHGPATGRAVRQPGRGCAAGRLPQHNEAFSAPTLPISSHAPRCAPQGFWWPFFAIPADGAAHRARTGTFSLGSIASGFYVQARQTVRLAKASPLVLLCLLGILPYGFAGIGVEGYWQPRLLELLNGAQPSILLGIFSCTSMGGVIIGGFLADRLVRRAGTARARITLFLFREDGHDRPAGRTGCSPSGAAYAGFLYRLLPDAGHVCLCGQCSGAKRNAG